MSGNIFACTETEHWHRSSYADYRGNQMSRHITDTHTVNTHTCAHTTKRHKQSPCCRWTTSSNLFDGTIKMLLQAQAVINNSTTEGNQIQNTIKIKAATVGRSIYSLLRLHAIEAGMRQTEKDTNYCLLIESYWSQKGVNWLSRSRQCARRKHAKFKFWLATWVCGCCFRNCLQFMFFSSFQHLPWHAMWWRGK